MASKFNFTQSSNPVMTEDAFRKEANTSILAAGNTMTVQSAVSKTFILFGLLLATSVIGFMMPSKLFMIGGAIAGLVMVLIASFKPTTAPITAPFYALFEGLFLGSISAVYASAFNGILLHAVSLTFGVLFMMLFIYKAGIIKVTEKFRSGVIMATGAIFLVYLLNFILSFFGINIPYLHQGGGIGILISLAIIGVASLNLLLDFDMFEKGEQARAPKYMEWFAGMGLLITLVWLYLEILRLLSRLQSND